MTVPPFFLLLILWLVTQVAVASPSENQSSAIVSHIPRAHVQSSVFASVGYSKRLHMLEIEFVNGAIYRYLEVAPSVYRELMAAESKARYYDANIKGNYRSIRVRPRSKDGASR